MWATSAHPVQLNGWKQILWIYWSALRGPSSGTGSHLHSGGPWGPSTSGWRHGSKTIMMRLVWACTQCSGALASHPLHYVFVHIHFQNLIASFLSFIQHLPLFLSMHLFFSTLVYPFLSPKNTLFLSGTRRLISWVHMHFKRCRRLLVPSWRIETSSRVNIKTLLCSLWRPVPG